MNKLKIWGDETPKDGQAIVLFPEPAGSVFPGFCRYIGGRFCVEGEGDKDHHIYPSDEDRWSGELSFVHLKDGYRIVPNECKNEELFANVEPKVVEDNDQIDAFLPKETKRQFTPHYSPLKSISNEIGKLKRWGDEKPKDDASIVIYSSQYNGDGLLGRCRLWYAGHDVLIGNKTRALQPSDEDLWCEVPEPFTKKDEEGEERRRKIVYEISRIDAKRELLCGEVLKTRREEQTALDELSRIANFKDRLEEELSEIDGKETDDE